MKILIKILSVLSALSLGAACLMLTGCHGSKNGSAFEVPSEFDTTRKYEITFWAKNDTNKNQTRIYEEAISDFEELYPNITVNMRLYTDYSKIYNDVITNIATGTTPNVCITYPDHIATYLTGENVVVPLNSLIEDEKYGLGGSELLYDGPKEEEIVPEFLEECRLEGSYYALPYMRSTEACYVNKTYVEKLGYELPDVLTWDYIWEVSEAACAKNSDGTYAVNGQNVMIPFIYKSTDNMMITMLKQKGAAYSDETGEIGLFSDTTEELLTEISTHVKSGAFSTFKISGYPANFLNAGQCIFAIDSTAGATWMGSEAPLVDIAEDKIVDFETAVRAVPQYDENDTWMISQGPSMCLFNKTDPQEVLASWLFMQYLLTNEVQTAYSETEGYIPVTVKAQSSEEYQDYLSRAGEDDSTYYKVKIEAAELLLENTANTFTTAVFNGSASLRAAAGDLIEETAKSTRRKAVIDADFFVELFSKVSSLNRLDQISVSDEKAGKKDLGPLPAGSAALLIGLTAVWLAMLVYSIVRAVKKKKERTWRT